MRMKFTFRKKKKEDSVGSESGSGSSSSAALSLGASVSSGSRGLASNASSKRYSIFNPEFDNSKGLSVVRYLEQAEYENIRPFLVLLNALEEKVYMSAFSDTSLFCQVGAGSPCPVLEMRCVGKKLLIISRDDAVDFDMKHFVDLSENICSRFVFVGNECTLVDGVKLSSTDPDFMVHFERALLLAQFERLSSYKALTATLISSIGLNIADIHMVMRNPFPYEDWCYIYVGGEWVKAWAYIDSPQKYGMKSAPRSIKFFNNNKSLSKKNLICYIQQTPSCQEAFFVRGADSGADITDVPNLTLPVPSNPSSRSSSPVPRYTAIDSFLDELDIIRYMGDVRWPVQSSAHSSGSSAASSKKVPAATLTVPGAARNTHKRTVSGASAMSAVSDANEPLNSDATKTGLLIKPVPHNGVHHLETMIRFIIPIFDCLQLYGRPNGFNANYEDPDSLLFALPKLPTIDYMAAAEFDMFLKRSFDRERSWSDMKSFLSECLKDEKRLALYFRSLTAVPDHLSMNNNRDSSPPLSKSAAPSILPVETATSRLTVAVD